ncbi:MAG: hypothetical protein K2Q17_10655 [Nitrospiraceae bacterium]|jgi:hypothetical protein|nr:hypothetical protein [Nitrospiraceae bacterium]OQW31440.1 MAG: hypothetical protein A4E20_03915 [Nitrospira sp. SG-bin2]
MNSSIDPQELVRRFNDDEEVWRRYCQRRELRRVRWSSSPLPDEILDHLDWLEAERQDRVVFCIGKVVS